MITMPDGRRIYLVEWYCGAQHPDGPRRYEDDAERNAAIAREHTWLARYRGGAWPGVRGQTWTCRPFGPKDASGGQAIVATPGYGRRRITAKARRRIERLLGRGRMPRSAQLDLLRRHRLRPIICWCGGWMRRRPVT